MDTWRGKGFLVHSTFTEADRKRGQEVRMKQRGQRVRQQQKMDRLNRQKNELLKKANADPTRRNVYEAADTARRKQAERSTNMTSAEFTSLVKKAHSHIVGRKKYITNDGKGVKRRELQYPGSNPTVQDLKLKAEGAVKRGIQVVEEEKLVFIGALMANDEARLEEFLKDILVEALAPFNTYYEENFYHAPSNSYMYADVYSDLYDDIVNKLDIYITNRFNLIKDGKEK